jgi:hypothetical protein
MPGPPAIPHLLNGLISYWKLDEANASATLADSVGTNNLGGATVQSIAGKINTANYWGDSAAFAIADNASVRVSSDFTFSLWVSMGAIKNSSILAKAVGDFSFSTFDYIIQYNGTAFVLQAGGIAAIATTPAVTAGIWYHLVVWWDSTDSKARIRVNDSTTYASTGTGTLTQTATPFFMGCPSTIPFTGIIDEVGFWKRKLTAAEMTQLFNGGSGWPFSSFTT